jgi:hypothetical protein
VPIWVAAYLVLLVAGAMTVRAVAGWPRPPAFLRVLVTRVAIVLLALSPLGVLILWFALDVGAGEPALLQAAAAGSVVAAGWLVTFVLRQYETMQERDQTARDTLAALREEIFTVLETLERTDWLGSSREMQALIRTPPEGQTAFFPFSSSERRPLVYETLAPNLLILDEVTTRAVVRFHAEFSDLRALVEDTKRADFKELLPERRAGFHVHLTTQRRNTIFFALRAIYRINLVLGTAQPEEIPRGVHKNIDILLDREGLV